MSAWEFALLTLPDWSAIFFMIFGSLADVCFISQRATPVRGEQYLKAGRYRVRPGRDFYKWHA